MSGAAFILITFIDNFSVRRGINENKGHSCVGKIQFDFY